jgi:hypothetical protein
MNGDKPMEEESEFYDSEVSYDALLPVTKKVFQPWHRPRKHYVREHQWCGEVLKMVKQTPPAGGVLKYLGLPGPDFLDLRHFHSAICEKEGLSLKFLGFNSSARPGSAQYTDINTALDEVKRLSRVDKQSEVIGDRFEMIANDKSLAHRRTLDAGPFDVVNLDLCDGFGLHPPAAEAVQQSLYNAVAQLFSLQARSKNPWLLLLTTRADRPSINDVVLSRLMQKYLHNLQTCEAFMLESEKAFGISSDPTLQAAAKTPGGLVSVFLTGLCKWLVGVSLGQNPPSIVEVPSVIGYRVNRFSPEDDLVSLAIKFTPTVLAAADPLGLAKAPKAPQQLDEGTMATKLLKRIAKRVDADAKLAEDGALNQRMIQATTTLLGPQYDQAAYGKWLQTL